MIKEKYAKLFVRESILKESYGMVISPDEMKRHFVEPFTDILKAAKLTLKDVGTGVLYNMRILFTFSTTKKQRLLNAYKQKQEIFKKEHEAFVKSLGDFSEAKLIAFMANPALYMGGAAIKKGLDAASFVNDVFKEQRTAMKDQEEGGGGPDGKPTGDARGPIRGALADLKNLFFGESRNVSILNQLLEIGGENPDITAEIEEEMKKQGIDMDLAEIRSGFDDFIDIKETTMKEIEDEGIPARIKALSAMMSAKNYDELQAAITSAKSADIDMGNYLKDFDTEMTRGKEEIAAAFSKDEDSNDSGGKEDSKLVKQMRKLPKIKKLGDKATEADFEEAMEEHLFNTLKSNLQEDGNKIIQDIQGEMQEMVGILLAPYESIEEMSELKDSSPEAEAIVEKIEGMVRTISGQ